MGDELGGPGDVSRALPELLERNRELWQDRGCDFLADSGSSASRYLAAVDAAGFTHGSVSYNKWTTALERTAQAQPERMWGPAQWAVWRDGVSITEQHGLIRPTPEGSGQTFTFAVVRFRRDDEFLWDYRFVACEGPRADAAAVFARHRLKGEKENLLKEVLRDLDLHHPPRQELQANRMFYALAALAYNVMTAFKLLHLPDGAQGWQVKTLLRQLLFLPAQIVNHARVLTAKGPGSQSGNHRRHSSA